jgi:hypothetical protein
MTSRTLAATLAALALTLPAGTAHADVPTWVALRCSFLTVEDPTGTVANPGTQVGVMYGGPIVAADLPASIDPLFWDIFGNPASATLDCSLQVDEPLYTANDAVSASSSGTVATFLPPTPISYQVPHTSNVFVCTAFTVSDAHGDSATYYWDDATKQWTTNPTGAVCAIANRVGDLRFG